MPSAGRRVDIDRVDLDSKEDRHFKIVEGKAEARVATYCGFSDRGDFRKFRFSPEVLRAFLWFHAHTRDADQREALGYLWENCRNEPKRQTLEHSLGGSFEHILARHPIDGTSNKVILRAGKAKLLAGILYWLRKEIQDIVDGKKSSAIRDYTNITAEWTSTFPDLTLPQIDLATFTWPTLGPLEKNQELECEAWNRCQAIINSLRTLTIKSKWTAFITAKKPIFSADPIPSDMVPGFMTRSALPIDLEIIDATVVRSDCTFALTLSHDYEDEMLMEQKRTCATTLPDLRFPQDEMQIRDPGVFPTGQEWRDTLRRSLHFQNLTIDFYKIRYQVVDPLEDRREFLFMVGPRGRDLMEWPKFKEHLEKSQAKAVKFYYTLAVFEEDDTVRWEYCGVPSNISSHVMLDEDGDAQFGSHGLSNGPSPSQTTMEASGSGGQPENFDNR